MASNHFRLSEKMCWSCEYFVCEKGLKKGFTGISIDTEIEGICSCKSCYYYNKTMRDEFRACNNYQRSSLVLAALKEKELKKEEERLSCKKNDVSSNSGTKLSADEKKRVIKKLIIIYLIVIGSLALLVLTIFVIMFISMLFI